MSDIDFLAVLRSRPTAAETERLIYVHRALRRSLPLAWRLEGEYRTRDELHAISAVGVWEGVVGLEIASPLSADNILTIRRRGIRLYGPDPRKLLPPVSRAMLDETMLGCLQEYRDRYEVSVTRSPGNMTNDLLNTARSLYALRTGRIISKTHGAAWAARNLGPRWRPALEAARSYRRDQPTPDSEAVLRAALPSLTKDAWRLASEWSRQQRP